MRRSLRVGRQRAGFVRSTERFFEEVLRDNLPISTFIDSDFTYANSAMRVIWEMEPKMTKLWPRSLPASLEAWFGRSLIVSAFQLRPKTYPPTSVIAGIPARSAYRDR